MDEYSFQWVGGIFTEKKCNHNTLLFLEVDDIYMVIDKPKSLLTIEKNLRVTGGELGGGMG